MQDMNRDANIIVQPLALTATPHEDHDLQGPSLNELEAEARAQDIKEVSKAVIENAMNEDGGSQEEIDIDNFEGLTISVCKGDGSQRHVKLGSFLAKSDFLRARVNFGRAEGQGIPEHLDLRSLDSDAVDIVLTAIDENEELRLEDDTTVTVTRVCHFLQIDEFLNLCCKVLSDGIDADNVFAILCLSDELGLSGVFEDAHDFAVLKIDEFGENPAFEELPEGLKRKLKLWRNAAKSSLIGQGHRGRLFFNSGREFLGIFQETIVAQQERLEDAKLRLQEEQGRISKHGLEYTKRKIAKQEERLCALSTFYNEQKVIMKGGMDGDDDELII